MPEKETVAIDGVVVDSTEDTSTESSINELTQEAKRIRADEAIKRNMLWSAGAGVLPVPVVELVAVTAVELKLIKELADVYGADYRKDLAKAAVVSLVGSLGSVTLGKMLAMSSLKFVPFIGHVVSAASVPALAAAITYAVGRVFVSHFETGGTLLDFDATKVRDYFRREFSDGMKKAAETVAPAPGNAAA